jgi:hypothetical protein
MNISLLLYPSIPLYTIFTSPSTPLYTFVYLFENEVVTFQLILFFIPKIVSNFVLIKRLRTDCPCFWKEKALYCATSVSSRKLSGELETTIYINKE